MILFTIDDLFTKTPKSKKKKKKGKKVVRLINELAFVVSNYVIWLIRNIV